MTDANCSRVRDAEAFEDGRLAGSYLASFEEHAQGCPVCTRELGALAELRETMRKAPTLESTPQQARRIRERLVRHVEPLGSTEARVRLRHAYLMFAAAIIAMVGFFVERNVLHGRTSDTPPAVTAQQVAAPSFDFINIEGAVVESKVDSGVARSSLVRGVAAFHVAHLGAGQRFVLQLPDGELEVHGTRFVVNVQSGRTQGVDVSEGAVTLRLHGEPEQMLHAGERWSPQPLQPALSASTPAPSVTITAEPTAAPHASVQHRSPAPASANAREEAASSGSPPPKDSSALGTENTAGARFIAASSAFQAGSYAQADALLGAFLRDFPRDRRCEDAAFLRAMARSRMGDRPGAAALARSYLKAFPRGLRRREAEQLAGER
jgi:hypothetical protein